jgi:hypothetical protein
MSNGVSHHAAPIQTPLQNLQNRPSLPTPGPPQGPGPSVTPLSQQRPPHSSSKQPKPTNNNNNNNRQSTSSLPAPPLDDVHAAFVEFRAKEEDKVNSILTYTNTNSLRLSVFVGPVHLLPAGARKEHQPSAPASARMPYLLECYERFDPCKQSTPHIP